MPDSPHGRSVMSGELTNPLGDPALEESYRRYIDSLEPCPGCGRVDEMDNIEGRSLCAACSLDDGYDDEWECTHCGGEGCCYDDSNPLEIHGCHACGGSGRRRDQTIF